MPKLVSDSEFVYEVSVPGGDPLNGGYFQLVREVQRLTGQVRQLRWDVEALERRVERLEDPQEHRSPPPAVAGC